jgi:hypothetical protein
MVSFTHRPLYPARKVPGTHWIGGWVDPRAGLDDVEKKKFLSLPVLQLRPLGHPARSQSLYRLSYPGFLSSKRTEFEHFFKSVYTEEQSNGTIIKIVVLKSLISGPFIHCLAPWSPKVYAVMLPVLLHESGTVAHPERRTQDDGVRGKASEGNVWT